MSGHRCTHSSSETDNFCSSRSSSLWNNVFVPLFFFSLILSVESLDPTEVSALDDLRNAIPRLQSMWTGDASSACSPVWTGLSCAGNHVTQISLHGQNLVGTIPPSLGNLTSLLDLILDTNQLSGTIPPSLGNLTSLQQLALSSNQLSGTLPSSLGNMISLKYSYFFSNQISGTIPSSLGNLTSLWYLYFSDNQLSGTIPSSLVNMTSLKVLQLQRNQLSGTIPLLPGQLVDLKLANNQLSGTIPSFLGNLTSLQQLDLSSNQLYGTVPSSLGNLTSLQQLDLHNNSLTLCPPPNVVPYATSTCSVNQTTLNCGCKIAWQNCTNNIAAECPCPQPPPTSQADCTVDGWVVSTPVSTTTVIISGNVAINGSVQVSDGIIFTTLNSHLSSSGCISIGGSVKVELSEEEVKQLLESPSSGGRTLASQSEGCNSIGETPLILKQSSNKSCKKLKIRRDNSQPATQFGVLFLVDKSRCNLWWIILASVGGGVLIIVVIVALLAMFTPLKHVIRPFTKRQAYPT